MSDTELSPAEVRAARKSLGLTQAELGAVIGRAPRAIRYWEAEDAPARQRITAADALLLRYMVRYGLPDDAL